jgi:hypothetical protein
MISTNMLSAAFRACGIHSCPASCINTPSKTSVFPFCHQFKVRVLIQEQSLCQLHTVTPSQHHISTSNMVEYHCETEPKKNPKIHPIVAGAGGTIARWVPGSVIKWAGTNEGFANDDDAKFAVEAMKAATNAWNSRKVGVTFANVTNVTEANFTVAHNKTSNGVMASAYFPNADAGNKVFIWKDGLSAEARPNLWKVLTHELGHVLGLRHEFTNDLFSPTRETRDGTQIFDRNPKSVMTYIFPPEIQDSDSTQLAAFYKLEAGKQFKWLGGTSTLKDFIPH